MIMAVREQKDPFDRMLTRVVTGSIVPRRATTIENQSLPQSAYSLRLENASIAL